MRICSSAAVFLVLGFGAAAIHARPAPPLPGTEISDDEYYRHTVAKSTILPLDTAADSLSRGPASSPATDPALWLAGIEKTWDAPPLATQLAADPQVIRMGMGAVFVPAQTSPEQEGEMEVMDRNGEVVATGPVGRKYSLLPGNYFVLLGSGPHKQKVVRSVEVREGRIAPVMPDWAALSIEVVNEKNAPFRGEYELARIDKFESFGRGFGRDPGLGEKLRAWTLKPGTYKIFGSGESYNSRNNFITVRLMPGELSRVTLVEEESSLRITGGGTDDIATAARISSNWKYGLDAGGTIDFNYVRDFRSAEPPDEPLVLSLLWGLRLAYKRDPVDWQTNLDFNQGISIDSMTLSTLRSSADEARLQSVFTWRLLKRFGPYGRLETTTGLIPGVEHAPSGPRQDAHPFLILASDSTLTDIRRSSSFKTQPSFSPVLFETGTGINANLLTSRWVDARLLTGIGLTYEIRRKEYVVGLGSMLDSLHLGAADYARVQPILADSTQVPTVIVDNSFSRTELGPEVLLNAGIRLGRSVSLDLEIKYFAPFTRINRPDVVVRNTARWRIARMVTLDYEFRYTLAQPENEKGRVDELRHRILARFSYTSR